MKTICSLPALFLAGGLLLPGVSGAEPVPPASPPAKPRLAPRPIPGLGAVVPPTAAAPAPERAPAPPRRSASPEASDRSGHEVARILSIRRKGTFAAPATVKETTIAGDEEPAPTESPEAPLAEGKIRIIPRALVKPPSLKENP